MSSLGCLWNRSRLDAYTDVALEPPAARAVTAHVERCPACRTTVERLRRLRDLVSVEAGRAEDPDWTGFWPAGGRGGGGSGGGGFGAGGVRGDRGGAGASRREGRLVAAVLEARLG